MNRYRRLEILLFSLNEPLLNFALPKDSTRSYGGQSGASPSAKRVCPRCQGVKRTLSGNKCNKCWNGEVGTHRCGPCVACDSRGWVWWDPMLNRQVEGSSERKVKTSKPRRPKKGGHGDLSNMMDALLAEREIRDKSSSRVAVDNALRTLYREDEPAWHCLQAFYVRAGEGLARRPTVAEEFAMHRGLQRLLGLLKDDPLRLPREMEIEALLDDNVSVNEIARCLGIHRGRVQKVKRKLAA